MANPLFQIEIPKRNTQCCRGGEKLVPGMEYYSMLLQEESQPITRRDYCLNCWQHVINEQALAMSQGYWKAKVEMKKGLETHTEKGKMDRALVLLKQLLQDPQHDQNEAFVLAIFLAHARRLILRQEREQEGLLYSLYEIAHQDEFVLVKRVNLAQVDAQQIQHSLAKKLE